MTLLHISSQLSICNDQDLNGIPIHASETALVFEGYGSTYPKIHTHTEVLVISRDYGLKKKKKFKEESKWDPNHFKDSWDFPHENNKEEADNEVNGNNCPIFIQGPHKPSV